jgi:hypothetical protein
LSTWNLLKRENSFGTQKLYKVNVNCQSKKLFCYPGASSEVNKRPYWGKWDSKRLNHPQRSLPALVVCNYTKLYFYLLFNTCEKCELF